MKRTSLAWGWSLVAAMGLAACGPPEGGSLTFKINYTHPAAPPPATLSWRANPNQGSGPPSDIDNYRLCITASDMDKPNCANFATSDYQKDHKARIDGIPVGNNRTVTFQGYKSPDNEVRWCGSVQRIPIKKDGTTPVTMFISVCSDFTPTSNEMGSKRVFHTATVLADGRVLVAGGFANVSTTSSSCTIGTTAGQCLSLEGTTALDIYDPHTGEFQPAGVTLNHPRGLHTATLVNNNRVLIAGGCKRAVLRTNFPDGPGPVVLVDPAGTGGDGWELAGSTAELVDVDSKSVTDLPMTGVSARAQHAAIALPGGGALLLGGLTQGNVSTAKAIRYNPTGDASNSFTEIPAMTAPRNGMALIPIGAAGSETYLAWGGNHAGAMIGNPGPFAEILAVDQNGDVHSSNPLFVTAQANKGWPAFYSAGQALPDGTVLVTGGMVVDSSFNGDTVPSSLQDFRLLDMTSGAEKIQDTTGKQMINYHAFHTATLLPGSPVAGEVLVAGGVISFDKLTSAYTLEDSAEFYSPADAKFTQKKSDSVLAKLSLTRAGHAATLLDDGTVLITGGFTQSVPFSATPKAEIYNPAPRTLRVTSGP